MMAKDERQTVLITGATDGLGRAAAVRLAEENYRVFAAGRNAAKRDALEKEAWERKLPLETVEMDVCDDESVRRAVVEVERRSDGIDALVNNAGIAYVAVMEEVRLEHLRQQMETNFFGVVRVTQAVLPGMRWRGRGRIVNVSSVAGKMSMPLFGPYSASKFALEGMTDALRLELHPFGIEVVLLEPAYIRTNMEGAAANLSAVYTARVEASPYAQHYLAFRRVWKERTRDSRATPEDFVRELLRALRESPPRPRYPVGRRAKMVNWAKRLLSDRALDRQMLKTFGFERR